MGSPGRLSTVAYFLVPELTTPQKKMKMRREQLGAELSQPESEPRYLDPDKQHEQARARDDRPVGPRVLAQRDTVLRVGVGLGVESGDRVKAG